MYHQLPIELRGQILQYLSQRNVAKLYLAYEGISVPELDAFREITMGELPYLDDCWDLVGDYQKFHNEDDAEELGSNYSEKSKVWEETVEEVGNQLAQLPLDDSIPVQDTESAENSDYDDDSDEWIDEDDDEDVYLGSDYSDDELEAHRSDSDDESLYTVDSYYEDSDFFPKLEISKHFDISKVHHLYVASEYLKEIVLYVYLDLDWSLISNRVKITAVIPNQTTLELFCKNGIERIQHMVFDPTLALRAMDLAEECGFGGIQKWTLSENPDYSLEELTKRPPLLSELSIHQVEEFSISDVIRTLYDSQSGVPLKKLSVRKCDLYDEDIEELIVHFIDTASPLEELDVSGCNIDEPATLALGDWFGTDGCLLTTLKLEGCDQMEFTSFFSVLAQHTNRLQVLHVDMCYCDMENLEAFCSFLQSRNNHLTTLKIDLDGEPDEFWPLFGKSLSARQCEQLSQLTIQLCSFGCETKPLFDSLPDTNIKTLEISCCCATKEAVEYLCGVFPETKITSLSFHDACLSGEDTQLLALTLLATERHLEVIDISGNSDIDTQSLCYFLNCISKRKYPISTLDLVNTVFHMDEQCSTVIDKLAEYPRKVGRVIFGEAEHDYHEI